MKHCEIAEDNSEAKLGKFGISITPKNEQGGPIELQIRLDSAVDRKSWFEALQGGVKMNIDPSAVRGRGKSVLSKLFNDAPLLEDD